VQRLASIAIPAVPFLTHLVNAGAVAVGTDGSVYFAPLVRDEIRKYNPSGMLQWVTTRHLFASETEPEFVSRGKEIDVRKALVNLAMSLGPPPDGRLYVLGADDSTATRLRLDVLDTASGTILATRHLGPQETAVAVSDHGEIATFSTASLLADALAPAREPFAPPFALPDLHGDTVTLSRFAGTVTLVNFWASWCGPCREEFPYMAKLYREFDRTDFEIAAVSDDVDRGKMLAFAREFQPPFPVLVGRGRMKQLYHYRGLPYSVLLDRQGRVIERIFGFGGAAEFQKLRETIALEVARGSH
jgi:thiol-disulfide isomerase/thioredoxin